MPPGQRTAERIHRAAGLRVVAPALQILPFRRQRLRVVQHVGPQILRAPQARPLRSDGAALAASEEALTGVAAAVQRGEVRRVRLSPPAAQHAAADDIAPGPVFIVTPHRPELHALRQSQPLGPRRDVVQEHHPLIAVLGQHHRHVDHGADLLHVVDVVGIAVRAVLLLLRALVLPGIGRILVPDTGGHHPIFVAVIPRVGLCKHLACARQAGHLLGSQVVQHILRHAQRQQLRPDRLVLRRILTHLPVHGVPLAQQHGQYHRRQRHAQIPPQHRRHRKAHRCGVNGVAGVLQRAGELHQIPQDHEVYRQHRQHQQPALQTDHGQRHQYRVKGSQHPGGGCGRLLRTGGAGDAHHTPPQGDQRRLHQRHIHIGKRQPLLHRQRRQHHGGAAQDGGGNGQAVGPPQRPILLPQCAEAQHQQDAAQRGQDVVQIQKLQRQRLQGDAPHHAAHGTAPRADIRRRRQGVGALCQQRVKSQIVTHRSHLPTAPAAFAAGGTAAPPRLAPSVPARQPSVRWTGSSNISGRTTSVPRRSGS